MQLFITSNFYINICLRFLTFSTKSSQYKMAWIKLLTKNICILFLFSTIIFAVSDLVDGHHLRLLQNYDDVPKKDHHFLTPDVPKKDHHFHIPHFHIPHIHIPHIFQRLTTRKKVTLISLAIAILLLLYLLLRPSKKR